MIVQDQDEGRCAAAEMAFDTAQKLLVSAGVMTNARTLSRQALPMFLRVGVGYATHVGFVRFPHISLMPNCCLPKS